MNVPEQPSPPLRELVMEKDELRAEHEALERALRVRIWNECKDRGMRDDDAYRRINREIEAVKTDARAALRAHQEGK